MNANRRLIGSSLDADLLIWTREGGEYGKFLSANSTSHTLTAR